MFFGPASFCCCCYCRTPWDVLHVVAVVVEVVVVAVEAIVVALVVVLVVVVSGSGKSSGICISANPASSAEIGHPQGTL